MWTHAKSRTPTAAAAALALVAVGAEPAPAVHRPMSIQNRLLLNHAAIAGLETLQVMVLVRRDRLDAVAARVKRLGGRDEKSDRDIGYLRVTVPRARLLDLVDDTDVDAYQISSFARGEWYRDGWPRPEADAFRYFDSAPAVTFEPATTTALPRLTPQAARAAGYTADDETGVGEWMRRHPTFDGRGVTIALLETGQADFTRLTSGTAKAIDGREIPKLAGIMNSIDPDAPDETRVDLAVAVHLASTWARIGSRTYVFPHAGSYRFGIFRIPAGSNVVQEFGVLEDEENGSVWIDTNGDASFQDERPIADVNTRVDVQVLKLAVPGKIDLSFVIAHDSRPHVIHIYCGRSDHQTMALSVAAGSRTEDALASGVAPAARVVLVRAISSQPRLVDFVEGYLAAAARADVDIICDSANMAGTPDTAADFLAALFARIAAVRGKLLFQAAGNRMLALNAAHPADGAFSVGGSIGPEVFAAIFGGGTLPRAIVHPMSAGGPSVDGVIKPDFLAPMQRLAASTPWAPPVLLPKNAPAASTGPGYAISCCTSASSPYAAGLAALLVSAARQEHVSWSVATVGRALRIGAQFLDDFPSYLQGNGVLDVNAAWSELTQHVNIPALRSTTSIIHPLAPYGARGPEGSGIFEAVGWTPGERGPRTIELQRESGPAEPVTYRLDWTGNDGTFATTPTITLPLEQTATLPVSISVSSPGVHSALLNVRETATDRVVFRTQATIVAAEPLDPTTRTVHAAGTLPPMRTRTHYVDVPFGTGALEINIRVARGIVRPTIVPSHTLFPQSEQDPVVGIGPELGAGSHTGVIAHPAAGMWAINLTNYAAWFEPGHLTAVEAEYAIDVRLLSAPLKAGRSTNGRAALHIQNDGSAIREPVLEASEAIVTSHQGTFDSSGIPKIFDIDVPSGASSLVLRARGAGGTPLELYLYDCAIGECFLQDFTIPASAEQILELRDPRAGQWRLAVNPAPDPAAASGFSVDEIVAIGKPQRTLLPAVAPGKPLSISAVRSRLARHAVLYELIDAAAERAFRESPWFKSAPSAPLNRAVAGWAVVPIH